MLTQSEADDLFAILKKPESINPFAFPHTVGELHLWRRKNDR